MLVVFGVAFFLIGQTSMVAAKESTAQFEVVGRAPDVIDQGNLPTGKLPPKKPGITQLTRGRAVPDQNKGQQATPKNANQSKGWLPQTDEATWGVVTAIGVVLALIWLILWRQRKRGRE
ncbi:hypothetical protein FC96_GL002445 [Secundilactobacillus kimchicus JCM 15530]|uniref:Gram-positive cocci surface proteins LPxTG domain-containing protein n=1 Tax=Secundilactobacillus kimchicus JCM 15530 TaxID=1302272 RepID=A0A0R1HM90_9LACO|nr:hypothetical protein FC96_GL002445 [Secundilactobacillus kimchicus JCM 15530]